MTKTKLALLAASVAFLASCEPSLTSAQSTRDNPNNMISQSQHNQRNLQRQDTINEVRTRDAVRHDQYEQVNSPLRTVRDGLGNAGAIRSNYNWLTR